MKKKEQTWYILHMCLSGANQGAGGGAKQTHWGKQEERCGGNSFGQKFVTPFQRYTYTHLLPLLGAYGERERER
jgi:hypothetical protein